MDGETRMVHAYRHVGGIDATKGQSLQTYNWNANQSSKPSASSRTMPGGRDT